MIIVGLGTNSTACGLSPEVGEVGEVGPDIRGSLTCGWRKIAGTENYTHAYLHGNPPDTHTCLGPCHPDGRTISHHSPSSSSSSSISKEPTNDHNNDHSSSSTSSSSNESSSAASSSSSSSADEQSNSLSSSSSASATNNSKETGQLSYASASVSK
ncbi:hypothetical protein P691DRAFT_769659 [Macrolepiota fuliginosa MF-IS2]|uniref:Uncharacterized protein n=1 Tax=Macrolepiota fuliginosa MF-IS2 TaxID=1400762 RepID=A0A9P5WX99_9AGAR|nr:hypothetical protein P691DRAFT_769659 [Macrolepiota fuliginosa MF-IS2]